MLVRDVKRRLFLDTEEFIFLGFLLNVLMINAIFNPKKLNRLMIVFRILNPPNKHREKNTKIVQVVSAQKLISIPKLQHGSIYDAGKSVMRLIS